MQWCQCGDGMTSTTPAGVASRGIAAAAVAAAARKVVVEDGDDAAGSTGRHGCRGDGDDDVTSTRRDGDDVNDLS